MPTRARRLIASLLLCSTAGSAGAGNDTIYKCLAANATPTYQSAPCADPETQAWVRPVADYASPESSAAASAARPPAATARPARAQRNQRPADGGGGRRSRCAAERRRVATERDEHWMHISIDDLRRMDAQIARACNRP